MEKPKGDTDSKQKNLLKDNKDIDRAVKSAFERIQSNNNLVKDRIDDLRKIREHLVKVLSTYKDIGDVLTKNTNLFPKKRNQFYFYNFPKRIWFKFLGYWFYIDFGVSLVRKDNILVPFGQFLYGTSYYGEKDKVFDKSLIFFMVGFNHVITPNSLFEDETWTIDEKDILDLHIRTIDKIWPEALLLLNKENQ